MTAGFPSWLVAGWQRVFDGDLGVRIFFVLSGYLITGLLLREFQSTQSISLKAFYLRRALRIWPLYFLFLGTLAVAQQLGAITETPSNWLMALTFTRNLVPTVPSPTSHFWSLAVEEQFYLVWPLLVALLGLARERRAAILGLVLAVLLAQVARLAAAEGWLRGPLISPRSLVRYCDSLALGCLAAVINQRLLQWLGRFSSTLVVAGAAALIALLRVFSREVFELGGYVATLPDTLEGVLIATAIVATTRASDGWVFRVLNTRGAEALGRLSYSLYVWHVIFVGELGGLAVDFRWWWLPTLLVAAGSHAWVERPFLQLKDRLGATGRR